MNALPGKKILLVENEAVIALAESRNIQSYGYQVVVATSGEAAVRTVSQGNDIDLILMDIHLGIGMDGTQAAREILKRCNVPIIFLTSYSEQDMVEKVSDIPRYGYVIKTSGSYVLQSSIEMALQLFAAQQRMQESEQRFRELYAAAQRQAQERALLDQVLAGITSDLDLPTVIRNAVEGIALAFGYPLVSLYLLRGDMLMMQYQVGYAQVIREIPVTRGVIGEVVRSGQAALILDVREIADFLEAIPGIRSEVCVPLSDNGKVVGAINIESREDMSLTEVDLRMLTAMGYHINLAISRSRLFMELREQEERYRLLFQQSPVGVLHFDLNLRVTDVNERLAALLKISRERLLNFDLTRIPDQRVLPALKEALLGRESYYEGGFKVRKQDSDIWLLAEVAPIYGAYGTVLGGTAIVQDRSERKRLEQVQNYHDAQMSALYETSIEINSQLDLMDLLNAINRRAAQLLQAPMGCLYIIEEEGKKWTLAANHQVTGQELEQMLRFGKGMIGQAVQNGFPLTDEDEDVLAESSVASGEMARELCVPLKSGREIIGAILVRDRQREKPFSPEEVLLVNLFADQAVLAIKNARLLADSKRQTDQLAVLNHIGQTAISNLELSQVLRTLHEQCSQVLPFDVFYVALYDEKTGMIRHPYFIDLGESITPPVRSIHKVPGLSGEVILKGKTVYIPDTSPPEVNGSHQVIHLGKRLSRSYVGVPLIMRGQPVGVLSIQSYQPNAYRSEQIQLLETIADQVAAAVNHALMVDEIQENSRYLTLLNRITHAALRANDMKEMLQTVADRMGELLQADGCFIALWDDAKKEVVPVAAYGPLREDYLNLHPQRGEITFTETVLMGGRALIVEDVAQTNFLTQRVRERYKAAAVLVLPLMAGGEKLGAAVISFDQPHIFTPVEVGRGEQAADQVALAILKLRMAITDHLTSVLNRRGFFDVGAKEIVRYHRYNSPLAVILFDIDHFKRVNDQYGHAVGDQVLCAVVNLCRIKIRTVDTLARYGGEEFAILLPETDLAAAELLAGRLCTAIGETPIETSQGPIVITVSMGVTAIDETITELDALINRADDAMYAAKRAGRNRVMVFVA